MTISSFCQQELLTHGPLTVDELTDRAVDAGVTRARNPKYAVHNEVRYRQVELLDGRWVTPLWLMEGRHLTTPRVRARSIGYYDDVPGTTDHDLGLLKLPWQAPGLLKAAPLAGEGEVLCLSVRDGQPGWSVIPAPEHDAPEIAALVARLSSREHPCSRFYGDEATGALRVVAQLLLEDEELLRSPLAPLSQWVPALVREVEREQEALRWHQRAEEAADSTVRLDPCQSIEVRLAAERAGLSTQEWVADAIDHALATGRLPDDGVVVSLRADRWI